MKPDTGFDEKLCTECAYRCKNKCSINDKYLWAQYVCPDGYTVDTISMFLEDKEYYSLTSRHTTEFTNWKTLKPTAQYPVLSQEERALMDDEV